MNRRCFVVLLALVFAGPAAPVGADDMAKGPRPGKYRIMSYAATNKPPLHLGSFVLGAGTYKAYLPGDKPQGEGEYTYDAATHHVTWKTGPYAGTWSGTFTSERNGKTHKIRLKPTTIATNTIN
jgi:hypothetical protein